VRIKIGKLSSKRRTGRLKRKIRVRKKVFGSSERPRLVVFRSLCNITAQIIDDTSGKTLAAASSIQKGLKDQAKGKSGKEVAKLVGMEIAKAAASKNIKDVVFDRGGNVYHGRVQALAESAREAGLIF